MQEHHPPFHLRWLIMLLAICLSSIGVTRVQGHGRLVEPPSRSSAWRYGFSTEKDYNDSEAYCGGWNRQHQRNGGKCGVCGDAWDLPQPRAHEHGGRYGQGVVVRTYKMSADIEIGVELTANHQGYFEFRICEHNLAKQPETDECFDRHLLQRVAIEGADAHSYRYFPGAGNNVVFRSTYKLPEGLTCSQCVLQWRYFAGNNWGKCPNGTEKVGCGPQEQFFGCADIRITEDGTHDSTTTAPKTTTSTTLKPRTRGTITSRYTRPTKTPQSVTSTTSTSPVQTESTTTTATTTTTTTRKPTTPEWDQPVYYSNYFNPGTYIGIIITLATLLFAIVCISGTILYFYYFHQIVKDFIGEQCRHLRSRVNPSERKAPLKLPASVFAQQEPPQLSNSGDIKPPVPPRAIRRTGDLRLLSLTISEPLDVTINGVSVPRDGVSPTASGDVEENNSSSA
ncbi:uncharacterized protein LOC124209905 [Daphnia pulex]|uniref:uncharacterized protein LOC124209905 n=1 Tax=Daphnia pulex TaxID=6669 RepID=UPI001EDFCED6|nr:uncharacterized protein LOC124209905 [Daphnia pulex]